MKNHKLLSKNADVKKGRDKIELVNCPHDCRNCKLVLIDINRLYHLSEQHQIVKEYEFSISSLKEAFEKTYELTDSAEQECAKLFRLTIRGSLENICHELKSMTSGFFRRGRYKSIYIMAEETLKEFKEVNSVIEQKNEKIAPAHSKDVMFDLPVV